MMVGIYNQLIAKNLDHKDRLSKTYLWSWYLFLFFLPLLEAPKNIFSVLVIVTGSILIYHRSNKTFNFSSVGFLLLIFSSFLAGADVFSTQLFFDSLNWAIMPLIGLIVLTLRFSQKETRRSLYLIIISTCVAIIESFFRDTGEYFELRSVGHVNQSALYILFSFICLFWIKVAFKSRSRVDKTIEVGSFILFLYYTIMAKSLVVVVGLFIIGIFYLVWCLKNINLRSVLTNLLLISGLMISVWTVYQYAKSAQASTKMDIVDEMFYRLTSSDDPLSKRDKLLNSSLAIAGDSLLGYGVKSFKKAVTAENLEQYARERNYNWDLVKDEYFVADHGHSILSTVVVERGWLGVLLFCGSFGCFALQPKMQSRGMSLDHLILNTTLAVVVICGLFQTLLHNEHGQLVFIILGLLPNLANLSSSRHLSKE